MWTINGSHHDIFPRDVYGMHEKCLKPHVKTFSSQIVPYGHLEIADADFGYVVTILSMTVWKSNLQADFNVRVIERFGPNSSVVLRELDASNRSVQKSAESTSI